jgi:hypothetical protein
MQTNSNCSLSLTIAFSFHASQLGVVVTTIAFAASAALLRDEHYVDPILEHDCSSVGCWQ